MLDFDVSNEFVTDQPTDTAYYRDARTHLKKGEKKTLGGLQIIPFEIEVEDEEKQR